MDRFNNKFRIESTRLHNWDYGANGCYFVTICTKDMQCFFGDIIPAPIDDIKIEQLPVSIIDASESPPPIVETQFFASLCERPAFVHNYTEIGNIAKQYWEEIPKHFPFVELDEFVIMPNHVHGILFIHKEMNEGWEVNKFGPQSNNLGSIIRGYKAGVKTFSTKNNIDFQWHPRFHDRIIHLEANLIKARHYIRNNPINWIKDLQQKLG